MGFRLERLLTVRKLLERAGEQRLGQAIARETAERERLLKAADKCHRARAALSRSGPGGTPAGYLSLQSTTAEGLEHRKRLQRSVLRQAEQAAKQRQSEQIKLWQDREITDRLKQRYIEAEYRQCLRNEQKQLDEIAGRQRRGGNGKEGRP